MSTAAGPRRWERIQALFEWVLDLPPDERAARLESEEADPALRGEVLSLLRHHHAEGRLDGIAHQLAMLTGRGTGRDAAAARSRGAELAELPRIGSYQVVRTLARGGMGSIHLARRDGAGEDRMVAIKLLRGDIETDALRRRFLAEQQIVASIAHPNIAAFLDDGVTPDGLPYFVMEYVDGVPIDEHCDGHRLPVRDRLELLLTVCEAVEHAHRRHLVHRDLKADNILVTQDGTVKLLDFGIAKALQPGLFPAADHNTTKGVRLLTPEFASPEQLGGLPVTAASDVYQLGLLLYQLLTGALPPLLARIPGEPPGRGGSAETIHAPSDLLRTGFGAGRFEKARWEAGAADPVAVAAARATTPRELRRMLRNGLDNVTMAALREHPEDRYATVAALRGDLRRCLDGQPVAPPAALRRDRAP